MAKYWIKPRIVFLTWAIVELIGWLGTHFFLLDQRANWLWVGLIIIGLIPMILYMKTSVKKLRNIMILWIVAMVVGMALSFLSFYVSPLYTLAGYLGGFWLLLMGVTFLLNAIWWTPRLFVIGSVLQIVAGLVVILIPSLLNVQYIIAAVAGSGAMLVLLPNK